VAAKIARSTGPSAIARSATPGAGLGAAARAASRPPARGRRARG
jgi:hypothetical protein